MRKILSCRKHSKYIAPIFLLLAISCFILCYLYSSREWNASQFMTFYSMWDFARAYGLEAIALTVFFVTFILCSKKTDSKFRNIFSIISFSLLSAGCIAVIITVIANCFGLGRFVRDYRLDCQLESDNPELFHEAIDSLCPKSNAVNYITDEPDKYIQRAARQGYPKAQNAMGCFYYQRAIKSFNMANSGYYGSSNRDQEKATADFDHAIYWFLKAAQNEFGRAQTNLGRIFMGDLDSNRAVDYELAKQWLSKATRNDDVEAYYYLGKIYSKNNLRDAYVVWSKGAELGDEACARELEKPEFAMGIPVACPVSE